MRRPNPVDQGLAAVQDLEHQLVTLVTVFAGEGVEPLVGRRLQRLKAMRLVDVANHADRVLPLVQLGGQKVSGAARRLGYGFFG